MRRILLELWWCIPRMPSGSDLMIHESDQIAMPMKDG